MHRVIDEMVVEKVSFDWMNFSFLHWVFTIWFPESLHSLLGLLQFPWISSKHCEKCGSKEVTHKEVSQTPQWEWVDNLHLKLNKLFSSEFTKWNLWISLFCIKWFVWRFGFSFSEWKSSEWLLFANGRVRFPVWN